MKKEINAGYVSPGAWSKGDNLFDEYNKDESVDPNEIILEPNKRYELKIDYPLENPFITTFKTGENGMSRYDLMVICVESYKHIYNEELNSSTIEASNIPGMYNRNTTNGMYGIWGHDIGDLIIHTFYIDGNKITLGVDS